MTTVYQYRIYCDTEADYVYTWAETEPTVCPNDSGHTIDTDSITIVDTVANDLVELKDIAKDTDNVLKMDPQPREGDTHNFYSPNFCDQTTWYEGGTTVADFSLTDSGDLTTWNTNSTHPGPWTDLYHGKIFQEDNLLIDVPTCGMKVEVSTDSGTTWVEKDQNTFGDTATGDYDVDYDDGTVTFNSALTSGDLARASFCKSNSTMLWTMKPATGKRLKLLYAEIQFSIDVVMGADIVYETWAYNPADLPNKIKISELRYKTLSDLLFESNGVYPIIPAFGGSGPRGIGNGAQEVLIFPFNYNAFRDAKASQGVEVRILTDKVHTGTLSTTTLYCLQEDE